MELKLKW